MNAIGNFFEMFDIYIALSIIIALALIAVLIWISIKVNSSYNTSGLEILAIFVIIVIFVSAVKGSFIVPPVSILIIETAFLVSIVTGFVIVSSKLRKNAAKSDKCDNDIRKRKKLINFLSILLIVLLPSIPFIVNSFGGRVFPNLETEEGGSLFLTMWLFIMNGVMVSFFVTIIFFFSDNILRRIVSPILTRDDIADIEKFCLYLRPFKSDNNKKEKKICRVTRNLYPVYAIGDPGKVLQPNGAERIFVTDDIWQETVKRLSNKSKLILLRIGQTDGTVWEITNIIDERQITKVIFLVYSQNDYDYFSNFIKQKLGFDIPDTKISIRGPLAFFFVERDGGYDIRQTTVNKSKDMERVLNMFLESSVELSEEYNRDLELRNHSIKYIFNKEKIPEPVRRSLNWGIISPLVNMDHWPIVFWGLLLVSFIIGLVTESLIPSIAFGVFAWLFGNRIEWAAGGWSCATLFLKGQRRKALFLWLGYFLGIVYSMIYIILFFMNK